ncbi:hypothetical protein KXV51_008544, partial [Aspergillus fumigatus]
PISQLQDIGVCLALFGDGSATQTGVMLVPSRRLSSANFAYRPRTSKIYFQLA